MWLGRSAFEASRKRVSAVASSNSNSSNNSVVRVRNNASKAMHGEVPVSSLDRQEARSVPNRAEARAAVEARVVLIVHLNRVVLIAHLNRVAVHNSREDDLAREDRAEAEGHSREDPVIRRDRDRVEQTKPALRKTDQVVH